jgi:protein-S-isoprenylcysteine O-methyltransferase Ste14
MELRGSMDLALWRILYWAWLASEVLLVIVTRTRKAGGEVQDRGSLYVLWIVIFASIWIGAGYGQLHSPTIFPGAGWVKTASLILMAAGLAIRWTSILSLGRAFSVNVAIHADQKLYRRGLFSLVRHPSYTGMLMIFAALGLRLQNWISLAMVVVPPLLALLYRMQVEEQALARAFGAEYEAYRSSTKRLMPGIY